MRAEGKILLTDICGASWNGQIGTCTPRPALIAFLAFPTVWACCVVLAFTWQFFVFFSAASRMKVTLAPNEIKKQVVITSGDFTPDWHSALGKKRLAKITKTHDLVVAVFNLFLLKMPTATLNCLKLLSQIIAVILGHCGFVWTSQTKLTATKTTMVCSNQQSHTINTNASYISLLLVTNLYHRLHCKPYFPGKFGNCGLEGGSSSETSFQDFWGKLPWNYLN